MPGAAILWSKTVVGGAALALALTGCGTVNQLFGGKPAISSADCRAADWNAVGVQDGLKGRGGAERLARYRDACEGFGVIPDPAGYQRGVEEGLARYCTPAQAYREGRAGRELRRGACATADPERERAFAHGVKYRKLRRQLKSLDDQAAGLPVLGAPGAGADSGRTPLYATQEFNPVSPKKRASLEAELRRYASWPPGS